ncbi:MAG: hypothetical protein AAGB93_14430, partial [Planctomycetota bacterium]
MSPRRAASVLALLGSASLAAIFPTFAGEVPRRALEPRPPTDTQAAGDRSETVERYLRALNDFRAGSDRAEALLLASARRLANRYGRRDALDVARYFRSLDPAERTAGLALERRFDALRDEAVRIDEADRSRRGEADALLTQLEADLEALRAEAATAADVTPAARCPTSCAAISLES